VNLNAALAGIRVLDFAQVGAGPMCSMQLGDLGAEVCKIEPPAGDLGRKLGPPWQAGESVVSMSFNRNKRSLVIDMKRPASAGLVLRMAKQADVVVESFRPGVMDKLGIGYEALSAVNPRIVFCSVSAYGQTGPYSDRPGFGTVAEALSGFANLNGFPDGPPSFPSSALADGVGSLWGVIGAMTSLYARLQQPRKRGIEVVDVALFEGLFRLVPTQIQTLQQLGVVQTRPGNYLGSHGALRNSYRTRDDKYFIISAIGVQPVGNVLRGTGATELLTRLQQGALSADQPAAIEAFLGQCNDHVSAWGAARDYAEVTASLAAADAVHSPVYSAADIMTDPHYRARDDVITVEDEELGPLMMQGIIPKFPGRDHMVRHAGRALGRDNAVFYSSMGIGPEELAALGNEGIV